MNIFLVTSPLQLLCAIEAKNQFQTKDNILILREEKSSSSINQMRLLLIAEEWDHIIYLGRKSKVWEAFKLQQKLKKITPNLCFERIFYADYSAWRTNVLLNNIAVGSEVMFDDGIGTIREFYDKIQPQLVVSHNKLSRDILLKLLTLKPPRKVYPRDNFSFFTFFTLPGSRFPVKINDLKQLQRRLKTSKCYSPKAPIGFIGQGMVAEKGINLEYYVNILKKLTHESNKNIIYFPHRTEAKFVKDELSKLDNVIYHESKLPLELEIATEGIKLSAIYGIASTASISLNMLYPDIEVFDLSVPTKHYEVKEFGENFIRVTKLLGINSITLE